MERQHYKEILGEKFEKQIFTDCYKYSMNNGLSLDWLNQCGIKQYYIVQCERVRVNLEMFPELKNRDNIIISDMEMNPAIRKYDTKATYVEKVYSKDHKCGRCNEMKISISKIQIRSADEGHTVVYTCGACGWKRHEN